MSHFSNTLSAAQNHICVITREGRLCGERSSFSVGCLLFFSQSSHAQSIESHKLQKLPTVQVPTPVVCDFVFKQKCLFLAYSFSSRRNKPPLPSRSGMHLPRLYWYRPRSLFATIQAWLLEMTRINQTRRRRPIKSDVRLEEILHGL